MKRIALAQHAKRRAQRRQLIADQHHQAQEQS